MMKRYKVKYKDFVIVDNFLVEEEVKHSDIVKAICSNDAIKEFLLRSGVRGFNVRTRGLDINTIDILTDEGENMKNDNEELLKLRREFEGPNPAMIDPVHLYSGTINKMNTYVAHLEVALLEARKMLSGSRNNDDKYEINLCVDAEDTNDLYPLDAQHTEIILQVNGKLVDAHFKIPKGLPHQQTESFITSWLVNNVGGNHFRSDCCGTTMIGVSEFIVFPDRMVNIIATLPCEDSILKDRKSV